MRCQEQFGDCSVLSFHHSSEAECRYLLIYYNGYIFIQASELQLILFMEGKIKQLSNQTYCTNSSENITRKKKINQKAYDSLTLFPRF